MTDAWLALKMVSDNILNLNSAILKISLSTTKIIISIDVKLLLLADSKNGTTLLGPLRKPFRSHAGSEILTGGRGTVDTEALQCKAVFSVKVDEQ